MKRTKAHTDYEQRWFYGRDWDTLSFAQQDAVLSCIEDIRVTIEFDWESQRQNWRGLGTVGIDRLQRLEQAKARLRATVLSTVIDEADFWQWRDARHDPRAEWAS